MGARADWIFLYVVLNWSSMWDLDDWMWLFSSFSFLYSKKSFISPDASFPPAPPKNPPTRACACALADRCFTLLQPNVIVISRYQSVPVTGHLFKLGATKLLSVHSVIDELIIDQMMLKVFVLGVLIYCHLTFFSLLLLVVVEAFSNMIYFRCKLRACFTGSG